MGGYKVSEFFDSMNGVQTTYFIIGVVGTVLFLLQTVFTFIDIGETFDLDADFDGEVDADLGFLGISLPLHLFSIRGIISFILVFGWAGFGLIRSGMNSWYAFLLALLCGFVMMLIISLIYFGVGKLSSSGNVDLKDAIGRQGEVYLTIPKGNDGMGKVHLVMNGSLKEYDAVTEKESIPTGEVVKVVDIVNDKLVVERKNRSEE